MTEVATPPPATRSRRRFAIGGGLLLAAVLLGLLLAWTSRGSFQGRYALPTAEHEVPATPAGPLPPPVAPVAPQVAAPTQGLQPIAPPDADAEDAAVDDDDAERIAGAIERTTEKALRRGETVRWHKAGEEGYVSVSEPRDYGDRVCRNVTATLLGEDGQTSSRSHMWCSDPDDDDDWSPQA